ncbi:Scr1 family TA system antitoxin-like transcriptional regulator [Nocardia bovistercoris]|uniref:XRE family transcriptional regulator n=1 Tax=Nocardia bovistercoris TaxID=2785916 RepID=A0A931N356_9NOCA|nr:Scr1 family TA system antitoxin-like transcriptional regulator [Nocardia bovistercoris]MBH0776781.1 XRE family transcriptional regulator [Nocardia bovistercoris]
MPTVATGGWHRLAEAVIGRRKELGMSTRTHLARASGLSYRLLGIVEHGARPVSDGTLAILEQALGWTPGSARRTLTGGAPALGAQAVIAPLPLADERANGPALRALGEGFELATALADAGSADHGARLAEILGTIGRTLIPAARDHTARRDTDSTTERGATRNTADDLTYRDTAARDTTGAAPRDTTAQHDAAHHTTGDTTRRDTTRRDTDDRAAADAGRFDRRGTGEPFRRSDPTVLRMALGEYLRHRREQHGMDHATVDRLLDCPPEFLSGLEAGRAAFDEHLLRRLLHVYGVRNPDVVEECVRLAGEAGQSGWWTRNNTALPPWFRGYLDHERAADTVRVFESASVPELLQTESYARAVLRMSRDGDVDRGVRARLERQHILFRAQPTRLWAIIDETILHRLPGTPDLRREQVEHLILMARKRNVTLQLAPSRVAARNYSIPFTLLRFGSQRVRRPDLVRIEDLTSTLYMDTARDVEVYAALWSRLSVAALPPRDTIDSLRRLADRLDGHAEPAHGTGPR